MIVSSWRATANRALASGIVVLLGAGCETERDRVVRTEQMLAAAGFHMEPATTPEREAQLMALPPHRLLAQPLQVAGTATTGYVYADPDGCHCLYIGDEAAYQRFQRLALEKQLADEHLRAAMLEENAAFNWSLWGPGFWGPGPVIVVPRAAARR
jgi:hypothetical protein